MWAYLLDTNILSESIKPRPNENLIRWMAEVDPEQCCLSTLTIGELHRGIALQLVKGDTEKAQLISTWLLRIQSDYADRILDVTPAIAHAWAYLPGRLTTIESLLAATALVHGLTVVTRNTSDFIPTGVSSFNPFSTDRPTSA